MKLKSVKNSYINQAHRNERGAIDLASIMVGILVIGMIGGVISATVFAVIPWTQDAAAKSQLDSIVSAESAFRGLSSDAEQSLPRNSFGSSEELAEAVLMPLGDTYCVVVRNDGAGYQGFSKSATGKLWSVTDEMSKPFSVGDSELPEDCSFLRSGGTDTPAPAPNPSPTPTTPAPELFPIDVGEVVPVPTSDGPAFTRMTYQCEATKNVSLPVVERVHAGTAYWTRDGVTYKESVPAGNAPVTKTLDAGVTYKVIYDGRFSTLSYENLPGADCLRSVDYWGWETGIVSMRFAFFGATNLSSVPAHIPSTVTIATGMFSGAVKFDSPNVVSWNTSNFILTDYMFDDAAVFNQPINNWNISKVTSIEYMFDDAVAFNQPLNSWNVTNVVNMHGVFCHAFAFNQSLNTWNVSKVTNMEDMFYKAVSFNQPLDNWDVSKVTNMVSMFNQATGFRQDLSRWNTASLQDGSYFAPGEFPNQFMPRGTEK